MEFNFQDLSAEQIRAKIFRREDFIVESHKRWAVGNFSMSKEAIAKFKADTAIMQKALIAKELKHSQS